MESWIILLVIFVVIPLILVMIYNRLVALKQTCNQAWGDIDVQLKQRHDLVPNLVETVKGYAEHEKGTLENVIKARQTAIDASSLKDLAEAETCSPAPCASFLHCRKAIRISRRTRISCPCRMSWQTWKTRSPQRVVSSTMRSRSSTRRSSNSRRF